MTTTDVARIRAGLDLRRITDGAAFVAEQIRDHWSGRCTVTPGDGTAYKFAVIDQGDSQTWMPGARYVLASNFGPLYPIPDHFDVDPGYAAASYVGDRHRNTATGVVYAEFIAALGQELKQ